MKGKRVVAVLLGVVLMFGSSMSVLAAENANVNADGTAVSSPSTRGTGYNAGNVQVAGSSYGQATAQSTNGTEWKVANDDDNLAEATTAASANKTDINVWARVSDASAKIYKIDIAWGSMKFEYVDGSGTWDVDSHTYTNNGGGVPHWVNNGDDEDESNDEVGCDGKNNQIVVTNHSNNAIAAAFAYTMLTTSAHSGAGGSKVTPFNDGGTAPSGYMDSPTYKYYEGVDDNYDEHEVNDVIGYFYGDNDKAAEGHTGVYNTYSGGTPTTAFKKNDDLTSLDNDNLYDTVTPTFLTGNQIKLPTAEAVGTGLDTTANTWGSGYVYPATRLTDADALNYWNTNNFAAGPRSGAVYFAFSGMPDEGQGAYLSAFKKVGTITVTITPDNTAAYNKPAA